MKKSTGVDEIHAIMEEIYSEEKDLDSRKLVRKITEESEKYLKESKLSLRRSLEVKTKRVTT